jgi:hypothetical protein
MVPLGWKHSNIDVSRDPLAAGATWRPMQVGGRRNPRPVQRGGRCGEGARSGSPTNDQRHKLVSLRRHHPESAFRATIRFLGDAQSGHEGDP